MKLHLDRPAFGLLIDNISNISQIRRDVIEKDYYVCLILKELSEKVDQGYAYFKGGTALYKALRSIRRFSEDIDLTVYIEDCPSASQAKKRLENAVLKYKSLPKSETLENKRGSITCNYSYQSMYEIDSNDELQRFGKVKVEATSFTVSEPVEDLLIAPFLYEISDEETKKTLQEIYEVKPFIVKTISLKRIFIDKVFASQFYYERKEFFDVAKHVYDITSLLQTEIIQGFLKNKSEIERMVAMKRKEEAVRIGGVSAEMKISDFEYFTHLKDEKAFYDAYSKMQKIYVLKDEDRISIENVFVSLDQLYLNFSSVF